MNVLNGSRAIQPMNICPAHLIEDYASLRKTIPILEVIRLFSAIIRNAMNADYRVNVKKKDRIWFWEAVMHLSADSTHVCAASSLVSDSGIKISIEDDNFTGIKMRLYQLLDVLCAVVDKRA